MPGGTSECPQLKHLCEHITPQYAPEWKELATQLGMPNGEIRIIEADNPRDVKKCCNEMLNKWLEIDHSATWKKVLTAIESPAVTYSAQFIPVTVRCE